ncbi:hypothetical protein FA10DRAFT_265566 [Acaromyces ingoldii]|uniref:Protein kinase domain-containing protein n=1 Tax=Acaromyces ingoldii TaxID=215250 RepID=A0A316YQZ9_9BASI|nr:hypothetical protein FA10DRAFT_265566 [Acaromyces ingoldii]PWN91719.1 hypothetical protein FA10DRAFT_265566 [Acaromyces ingoldii]
MAIARDTLEAMRYLHDVARVAHRDVKPSNIVLFTQKGSPFPRPVLIDFGTAQSDVSVRGPGGNGQEKQESCVGTGAYRAPETLFAPSEGYDAVKVDMWEWATTVIEGFLQLEVIIEDEDEEDGLGYEDEFGVSPDRGNALKDLEQALWADDDGQSWSDARVPKRRKSSLAWEYNRGPADASKPPKVIKTYRRKTLFEGNRGDLGLAGSIFALRELPSATKEGEELWPESVNFQPPLSKMPFIRRPPDPGGLRGHLEPIFSQLMQSDELTSSLKQTLDRKFINLLDSCLQLSASRRPSASQALYAISNTSQ